MHRTIEVAVPSVKTPVIREALEQHQYVIGLNINRGASMKPIGDVFQIHVLNKGADDVLRICQAHLSGGSFNIITSEVASINDPEHQQEIDHDYDEALWEEMETGLRHNGRLTSNFLWLMALGGFIAAMGFVSDWHQQLIAFIAASIIAPGLEPIAKIPLGLVLRRKDVCWVGIKALAVGYLVLMLGAAAAFGLVLVTGEATANQFLSNAVTQSLLDINQKGLMLSAAGASASIIMYLAYRRNVIAGPLIALILIPAASAMGMSMVIAEWDYAWQIGKRLGLDIGLVIAMGFILIYLKQVRVHKRLPMR